MESSIKPLSSYLPPKKSKLTKYKERVGGLLVKALVYGSSVTFWIFLILLAWDFGGRLFSNVSFTDKQIFASVSAGCGALALIMLVPIFERLRLGQRLARINKQAGTAFKLQNTCGKTTECMLSVDATTKQILVLPAFGKGEILPFSYVGAWHHESNSSGNEMVIHTNDIERPIIYIPVINEREAEKWQNKLVLLLKKGENK